MRLAFCLYKYFPYGGMQRDFLRIALECVKRGAEVRVYTMNWEGSRPDELELIMVPARGLFHHRQYQQFSAWVQRDIEMNPVDCVVGFNKMPELDVYYAADSCYEEKARTQRNWLYRMTPRYRHFRNFERAVFHKDQATEILMISSLQQPLFEKHYATPLRRFHLLPPGIARDRMAPGNADEVRHGLRSEFHLGRDDHLLLFIGSGFVTKGLDRVLLGMRSLAGNLRDHCQLIVIGQDNPRYFRRMAHRLGIASMVSFLSGRDDIPRFLLGADLLLHPAYAENTGTVLLEAVIAGLPVLTTDACGYASYVKESGAGEVIDAPYRQERFDVLLEEMLESPTREEWRSNGVEFGRHADIYNMPGHAAEIISRIAEQDAVSK